MAKYLKTKQPERKSAQRKSNTSSTRGTQYLLKVRKRIYRQALLALLTIVLTVVILFAMTSAWYTNIVQTGGLTFEAEAWGFDGKITVQEGSVRAAPGDDGVVHLTVNNNSDAISAISVNVTKDEMDEEMQKRLFFYVDAHMNRSGETMERVYLNKFEGFTYNVFSNGQLTLTEQVSNAPVIKWQWVYDVLGYYVLAKPYEIERVFEISNEDGTTATKMVKTTVMDIQEYLRPIEYDFDEATTVISTDEEAVSMEISTVDGKTHPEVFLQQLSKRDGYEGEIEHEDKLAFGNYYKVDVDENGYGVYAYLCNYTDIMLATDYDTELGELARKKARGEELKAEEEALLSNTATLTLSAQKNEGNTINVNTLGALRSAVELGTANIIQLSSNITLAEGETLTIPANARVMLDLNGHTITNMDGTAIKAEPGSSLTMINGVIFNDTQLATAESPKTYGIYSVGAEVVMSKMEIRNFQYGIYVGDYEKNNELDSRVYMETCRVDAKSYAAFICGNGVLSEQKSQLIIEKNSVLRSSGIVVTGSGDSAGNGKWGTDIQIIDSMIEAELNDDQIYGGGIYHPQKNSTLTVFSSTVKGYNGITVKGGNVSIVDSNIVGLGNYQEPKVEGNGYTDTGDAVYVETSYGYEIRLEIGTGSILTHMHKDSKSLRIFKEDATNVSVQIESGTFDEPQPVEFLVETSATRTVDGKTIVVPAQ